MEEEVAHENSQHYFNFLLTFGLIIDQFVGQLVRAYRLQIWYILLLNDRILDSNWGSISLHSLRRLRSLRVLNSVAALAFMLTLIFMALTVMLAADLLIVVYTKG